MNYLDPEISKLVAGINQIVPKYSATDLEKDSTKTKIVSKHRILPLSITWSQMSYDDKDTEVGKGYTKEISYSVPVLGNSTAIHELERKIEAAGTTQPSVTFSHGYPDRGVIKIVISLKLKSLTDSKEILEQGYDQFHTVQKLVLKESIEINKDIEKANDGIEDTISYEMENRLTLIKLKERILSSQPGHSSHDNDKNKGNGPK